MASRWDITKAVRSSDLAAPARLIMLVLADVAEVGTAEIPEKFTPSVAVLARESGLSKRTVQTHLAALETAGWIERIYPATPEAMWRGDRIRYRLVLPDGVVQEMPDPSAGDALGVVQEIPGGGAGDAPLETDLSDQHQISSDPSLPHSRAASKKPTKRGTRIPDDFRVTPGMVAWARERVPTVDGRTETEKFVNYWSAKAGRDAVKLDWEATWKNWMLTAAGRLGARASPKTKPDVLDDPAVRAAYDELFPLRTEVA